MVKYNRLIDLLNRKGESFNSLFEKGIITGHAARKLSQGKPIKLEQIADICRYFNVPIEMVVEVKGVKSNRSE